MYLFMLLLVAFTALPLVYMVSTAFKPIDELFIYPPQFLVRRPTLESFTDLFTALDSSVVPFTRYVFNSLFTTIIIVSGTVIISSMGAFAMGKYNLPGTGILFNIIILALMFSPYTTQIPSYMIVNKLGMINTYWALIIPKLAVAYNFFLMKQFSSQIPDALLEAARIEGATEWRIFWKIAMPILQPAWATLIVFSFVNNWNDYFTALIFTSSQVMKTLPLALQTIAGGPGAIARSGASAAATFIVTLPTILIFTIMQAKVMKTMAYSGIKA
ncbi:MAG TPA: carbohydrate ABC transporter permease [Clostridiales bacterium]|nr:carbohydrate ABC transporter permease [Clostridiales bacterium]